MTRPVFVDTSVFLYALGAEHPMKPACQAVVAAAEQSVLEIHICVEAVQEVVHHRMRRADRASALSAARRLMGLARVHDFDRDVLLRALTIIEASPVRGRDAVHAATAMLAGFEEIVTADRDFVEAPGLRVLQPQELMRSLE